VTEVLVSCYVGHDKILPQIVSMTPLFSSFPQPVPWKEFVFLRVTNSFPFSEGPCTCPSSFTISSRV